MYRNLKFKKQTEFKQECIPVGCVPPVALAIPGGSSTRPPWTRPPRSRHPPGPDPLGQGTPWSRHPQSKHPPPGSRHPLVLPGSDPRDKVPPWSQAPPPLRAGTPRTRHPRDKAFPQDQTPSYQTPLLTESQTSVKILPCPNFVAGGKR